MVCSTRFPFIWSASLCFDAASFASRALLLAIFTKWSMFVIETGDEDNDSPIEQVRLTVPPTDDPTQPTLTFRTWVLGLISCVVLSFEHVLITIFANSGAGGVYALHIVTGVKAFYHRSISGVAAYILSLTTQMPGYGWAGLFRKYLVDSPYMWWPANLVQIGLPASFAYYIVPSYFFPSISAISLACLIWKDSVTAQQIGGGISGLGLGSFGLDWSTIASFLGTPLATPGFAIINILVGFMLFVYVVIPIAYWTYDSYSKLYLSVFFAFTYGLSFATLTATLTHVALFNGK
nr:oligopeptide transporter 7-like [Quercus suber]